MVFFGVTHPPPTMCPSLFWRYWKMEKTNNDSQVAIVKGADDGRGKILREEKSKTDKLEVMYYCERCDCAWWYDETGQLHGSIIPPRYKENIVKNAEHKLCKDCEKKGDEIIISRKEILQKRNETINKLNEKNIDFWRGNFIGELEVYNEILKISGESWDDIFTEAGLKNYYESEKAEAKRIEKAKAEFNASRPKEEQNETPDDMPVECISDRFLGEAIYGFNCERCNHTWEDNFTPSRCASCGSDEVWGPGPSRSCANCGSSRIGWFCPKCNSCKVESLAWDYGHIETIPVGSSKHTE